MNTLIGLLMAAVTIPEDAIFIEVNGDDVIAVMGHVNYDLASGLVSVTLVEDLTCLKDADRLFSDRFEDQVLTVNFNNGEIVDLEEFIYDIGDGIITIKTSDPIVCS